MSYVALFLVLASPAVCADDAERGRQLMQSHCIGCHGPASPARNEVADAPPLDSIARKYGHDAGALAFAILAPHPKMNVTPAPEDARAIAAWLAALPR
jgi:mono/diheme cytochrome c family protein